MFGTEIGLSSHDTRRARSEADTIRQIDTGMVPDSRAPDPSGTHLVVLADGPDGYARLSRVLSTGHLAGEKGAPQFAFADLADTLRGHSWALTGCRKGAVPAALVADGPAAARRELLRLVDAFGRDRVLVELWDHGDPLDSARNDALVEIAHRERRRVRGDQQRPLRHPRATQAGHGARRGARPAQPRPDRPVAPRRRPAPTCARGAEQARRFRRYPGVVERAAEIGRAAAFDLSLVAPKLPPFPCPPGPDGRPMTEMQYLRRVTEEGARRRYGDAARTAAYGVTEDLSLRARAWTTIDHELALIEQLDFAGYFLIVWDIVEFCRRVEHLLPGPGERRQLGGLLRHRGHRRRRRVARAAVRAVPVARARRPARHRRRHRERPTRRGDPVRLRALRPAPHRPGRQRHHLPGALGGAGHGQGTRVRTRPAGRLVASRSTVGAAWRRPQRSPTARSPQPVLELAARGRGRPAPSRHPLRRDGHLRPSGDRGLPRRVGPDGQTLGAAVGQGRLRPHRAGEVRPARPRDAVGAALRRRSRPGTPRLRDRPGHHPPGRRRVRDALPGRHRRGVPDRVAGPDGDAAAAQAAPVLRPRGRGGADPARPDPGRFGASVHPAPQRAGADHLPASAAGEQPRQDPRGAAVPGAADADGDRRRRVHAGRVRRTASGDGIEAVGGTDGAAQGAAVRRDGRAGDHRRRRRGAVRQDEGVRQLRLPRVALGEFRLPRLRVVVDQVPRAGGVLCGAAQRPADGVLVAAHAGARRPPPRRGRAHPRPQRVAGGCDAGAGCGRRRTGWRSGWGSDRCVGSARSWPRRSRRCARRVGCSPTPRTSCAGCRRSRSPSSRRWRPAGVFGECFGLDRRMALWTVGATAQSRPGRLAGVVTGAVGAAAAGDDPGRGGRRRPLGDRCVTRWPPDDLRARRPDPTRCAHVVAAVRSGAGFDGAGRRGGHPPSTADDRAGDHVPEPGGRDRVDQRGGVEGLLGEVPQGRPRGPGDARSAVGSNAAKEWSTSSPTTSPPCPCPPRPPAAISADVRSGVRRPLQTVRRFASGRATLGTSHRAPCVRPARPATDRGSPPLPTCRPQGTVHTVRIPLRRFGDRRVDRGGRAGDGSAVAVDHHPVHRHAGARRRRRPHRHDAGARQSHDTGAGRRHGRRSGRVHVAVCAHRATER